MPILREELVSTGDACKAINMEISVKETDNKKLSFFESSTRNDFNHSLKKMENILITAYNQANANYNSFFYNINMLTLPNNNVETNFLKLMNEDTVQRESLRMKIIQGVNTELNDGLRMTLGVVLKAYKELEKIQYKIQELIEENRDLRDGKAEQNASIQDLKHEITRLKYENHHLNEKIKERTLTCNKYKSALNKSIKAMKRLYFENDSINREIGQLENQLVVSKLKVAQHNEELEHIRTLLKYYKNQVKSECILPPSIEQIIKVEPCRIVLNAEETQNVNQKLINNKPHSNISNILSKLLFNNGSSSSRTSSTLFKQGKSKSSSNNSKPKSRKSSTSELDSTSKIPLLNNKETLTPIKSNKKTADELSSLLSTDADYNNINIHGENTLDDMFEEDERFINELMQASHLGKR
ncbi:coiled coil protein [Cryptosporidium felis]|nr:coiled coil protein [Cryptosporidium felis]